MFSALKNKQIIVFIGSNSGAGVSLSAGGMVCDSVIKIVGTLSGFDDKFLHLTDAKSQMVDQVSGVGLGANGVTQTKAKDMFVSIDKILFIQSD